MTMRPFFAHTIRLESLDAELLRSRLEFEGLCGGNRGTVSYFKTKRFYSSHFIMQGGPRFNKASEKLIYGSARRATKDYGNS